MELRTLARANMMAMPEIVRIAGRHLTKSRREIQIETFFPEPPRQEAAAGIRLHM